MANSEIQQALRKKVSKIRELPAMPAISNRLVQLRENPDAGIADLAAIIKLDPGLSSKLVRYAASPFFGYGGSIQSIEDAVGRVLGFDKTLNMALAMDTGQAFDVPLEGPIGLKAIWRQSLCSAQLMQYLAEGVSPANAPNSGLVYMSGLLHNIGFFLLGHLFREEFKLLNKLAAENPKLPVTDLEQRALGMSHTELGVWLMREWSMPAELITVTFEHHNAFYKGRHFVYANLTLIANRLLRRLEIGDEAESTPPPAMLRLLGLEEAHLNNAFEKLLSGREQLESMIQELHG